MNAPYIYFGKEVPNREKEIAQLVSQLLRLGYNVFIKDEGVGIPVYFTDDLHGEFVFESADD